MRLRVNSAGFASPIDMYFYAIHLKVIYRMSRVVHSVLGVIRDPV